MTLSVVHQRINTLLLFFGGSFVLHLLWENLQAQLYAGFTSFREHFWICFKATGGDLLFMLAIYAALVVMHRNIYWIADRSMYAHPATWVVAPVMGILLAVGFELWAVHVGQRWQYTEAMPLIPLLQIGITPVLQMLLIPLTVLFLVSRISHSL